MEQRICNQEISHHHSHTNVRRTGIVVILTLVTMVSEIVYGLLTGSMALLADGIHMGTHTFALIVTLIAYRISARQSDNPDFAFSSGKIGILGGYTNAIFLGITAIAMLYEAVHRLLQPEPIIFNQALIVAVIGLSVNIVSALLLSTRGHEHDHDHNLRSAYIHVVTDAMTSVLAIIALLAGKFTGRVWPDPLVAILGVAVILKWAYGLAVSSGRLLCDFHAGAETRQRIISVAGSLDATVSDLHVWQTSEKATAAAVTVRPSGSVDAMLLREKIREACGGGHLTLEIEPVTG